MPYVVKWFGHTTLLGLFLTQAAWGACPLGDLNADCSVDWQDIQALSGQWLSQDGLADINGDLTVNFTDFALAADTWRQSGSPLLINELMAANTDTPIGSSGDLADWIEIYNAADEPIDLGGMYLTDDLSEPTQWRFPLDRSRQTTIDPHGYLLVWADGDVGLDELHANFRLSAQGEEVGLFDTDGTTLLDSLSFDAQTADISFGRIPDAGHDLRFFGHPTPGEENSQAFLGEVEPVMFSHTRGFYEQGFDLTLSCATPAAKIYYTLDGRDPLDPSYRRPPGLLYRDPLRISKRGSVRAAAVLPGWKPSVLETHSFILNASSAIKSLPVISLVGDEGNTFYEPRGVMAVVGGSYSGGVWQSSGAGSYNNFTKRGYERPVSFEWIEDQDDLQINCGLRVHGSDYMRPRYTRSNGSWSGNAKISFRLYFDSQYGPSWLEYPLFPYAVDRFKTVVLRGGHNDRNNPFIKDELVRRLHQDMGQVASSGTLANLFINGEHKGYFNPCEHIKDSFFQTWYNSDQDWDVMTMSGIRDGDSKAWNTMLNYARNQNLSQARHYEHFSTLLDIPAFVDYAILQLWAANWDWPNNNWSAARERSPEGRWRFMIWDAEGIMETNMLSRVGFTSFPSWAAGGGAGLRGENTPIAQIYRGLRVNQDFAKLFGDRLHRHFFNHGALTEPNIRSRFLELKDMMAEVLPNMDMYILNTWVPQRLNIFLNACISERMYTFAGPTFAVNGAYQHGGPVATGAQLSLSSTRSQPIHYTLDGSDVGEVTTPTATWTTLIAAGDPKSVYVPTSNRTRDTWKGSRAFDDSQWTSVLGGPGAVGYELGSGYADLLSLDLTDSMFAQNASCYVRIPFTNNTDTYTSLELHIQYDDGFIAFLNGHEVARRNFVGEPAWNSTASAAHDDDLAMAYESIDVSDHIEHLQVGDNILALQGLNASTTSADFLLGVELVSDISSVPASSQVYTGPLALSHSVKVKARTLQGQTWSALTEATFAVGPVAESLRVTELMYHPPGIDDPNTEFVELGNLGDETINLNLVTFADGIEFAFPNLELAPDERVLLVRDVSAFTATYGPDLPVIGQYQGSLSNAGEWIELQDAVGRVIQSFRYQDNWYDLTDGAGFSLTLKASAVNPDLHSDGQSWRLSAHQGGSPGWDDAGDMPAPGSIVINELMANPAPGESDWIELHNTTDQAWDISGWFLSDDDATLMKYEIPVGTVLEPHGYVIFDQDKHFGDDQASGTIQAFGLSARGETLTLHGGQDGALTGYVTQERFAASEPGCSFGRYGTGSGAHDFVPLAAPTPGQANADPRVGSIVISEIMYHPPGVTGVPYVELANVSDTTVSLFDEALGLGWRFISQPDNPNIDLVFPAEPLVSLRPQERLILTPDSTAFAAAYGSSRLLRVIEWGPGQLAITGDRLQLSRPVDADNGQTQWRPVDRVDFSNGSQGPAFVTGIDPWPIEADGLGAALIRSCLACYGNDPAHWQAGPASPGQTK